MKESEIMHVKDVMQYLHISVNTVYAYRLKGMPSHTLHKGIRATVVFYKSEVDEWVKGQKG